MKKKTYILGILFMMIIFPGIILGQTEDGGMDMELYKTFLYYGLLVLVFIMFTTLIYFTSPERDNDSTIEKIKDSISETIKGVPVVISNPGLESAIKSINVIYYIVMILIIIYSIILIFTII